MPLFCNDDMDTKKIPGVGSMSYSATRVNSIEDVGASCFTLVTIAIDVSGSVRQFAGALLTMLKTIIEGCKKDQYSETIIVRVITFNSRLEEVHGFKLLMSIDENLYESFKTGGSTALYDAVFSCVGSTLDFAETLTKRDLDINSINFMLTDGSNNDSVVGAVAVKDKIDSAITSEKLDSITNILIQLNDPNKPVPGIEKALLDFKTKVGITKFMNFGDATPENIANLAEFVLKSTSSASASVNSGTPIDLNV